ncbi:MAG: MBL fold metallo-hydrolase [Synergistes sp.]|nr:MBL fold metallo-hydrolase [Synergistes sp.]
MEKIFDGFYRINLPIARGGFESFLDGWLICDEKRNQTILVETGPASVVPGLLRQLEAMNIAKIDYLIYTHIHLDHAGGAGQFAAAHKETKILAPEKGRKHLTDPSKLIEASKVSLGSLYETYGAPVPLPCEALISDGEIGGLTVIDTPGHSPHHSSYIYEIGGKKILFAGEAAGCWYRFDDGDVFMRPATPHKFYYDTAMASLEKLTHYTNVDIVCFPHSGYLADASEVFETAIAQMKLWLEILSDVPKDLSPDDLLRTLRAKDPVLAKLGKLPEEVRKREEHFIKQSAKGFMGWIQRNR